MLDESEEKIIETIKDRNYLNKLNISPTDVVTAVKMALKEFNELKEIVNEANGDSKSLEDLCRDLKGHNGEFNNKYPLSNYFDVNYKSLLVTITQDIDENNNKSVIELSKSGVYIYPDNITNISVDEMFMLDFYDLVYYDEKDFKNIEKEIEFQVGDFVKDKDGIVGMIEFIEESNNKPYVVLFQDVDEENGRWWCAKEELEFASNKEITQFKNWYKNEFLKENEESEDFEI